MAQTKAGALKIVAAKHGLTVPYLKRKLKTQKWCSSAKHWQPITNFGSDITRSDRLDTKCHSCRRSPTPYASLKGRVSTFKGKKHTEETKAKLSEKIKALNQKTRLGVKHTIETRQKISDILRTKAAKGSKCHSYKDGKMVERRGIRFSVQYKRWRYDVFLRDKFTCQKCGDARGGNLNAHHIKPFADFPELRMDIDNGITLCEDCHKAEHVAK